MIDIEAGPEGFTLSADGKRVLSHSRRSPCVEIGHSENLARQSRAGYFKLKRRCATVTPLRTYKILERSGDLVVVDFEGKLCMAARWKDGCLRLSFSRFDSSVNLFRLRLLASPDERVFGCGERYDRLDLKGGRLSLWVRDASRERGASSYPLPAYVSTKNYWCAVDSPAYARIDFRRASTTLDIWAVPREIVIGRGKDAQSAVAGLGVFLGGPPVPPDWSFNGAWIEARGGIEETRRKLDAALRAGVKVAALWSRDWCSSAPAGPGARALRECHFDEELYPGLPSYIAALRSRGTRFIGYVSPLLDLEGELYAEASAQGFCVKNAEGGDYLLASRGPPCAMIDLTGPEAVGWIKRLFKLSLSAAARPFWFVGVLTAEGLNSGLFIDTYNQSIFWWSEIKSANLSGFGLKIRIFAVQPRLHFMRLKVYVLQDTSHSTLADAGFRKSLSQIPDCPGLCYWGFFTSFCDHPKSFVVPVSSFSASPRHVLQTANASESKAVAPKAYNVLINPKRFLNFLVLLSFCRHEYDVGSHGHSLSGGRFARHSLKFGTLLFCQFDSRSTLRHGPPPLVTHIT